MYEIKIILSSSIGATSTNVHFYRAVYLARNQRCVYFSNNIW